LLPSLLRQRATINHRGAGDYCRRTGQLDRPRQKYRCHVERVAFSSRPSLDKRELATRSAAGSRTIATGAI
jgi:hypothetical protein